jgi:hypothetical protein
MAEQYIPQNVLDSLPKQFETKKVQTGKFVPTKTGIPGSKVYTIVEKEVVEPPPNAIPVIATTAGQRGTTITKPTGAYYIPLDIPNYPKTDARGYPVSPLIAKYDSKGKLTSISSQERYWADSANSIVVQPEYNLKGELVSTNAAKNEGGGGGFGDFLRTALEDFGPMIALGVGANYLAPLLSGAGAAAAPAAAAGSGALSPYAAQAAGAYGGSAAAASAAAAGNLAGIQAASAAQNALTQQALSNTGLTFGGDVPTATPDQVFQQGVSQVADLPPEVATETTASASDIAANDALAQANRIAQAAGEFTPAATTGLLSSLSSLTGLSPETLNSLAPSAIQGLLSAGGSYLQSEQAKEAAQTQADAQIRAAQIAADAAKFRPVGVTTRFGSSNFQTDAAGNVIGAGYTPSPEILGYQNRLSALANQGLTGAEGAQAAYAPLTGAAQNLFSLGQSYLSKTPEQAAQEYIAKQQALLTPSRENQLAELRNRQFQTGRGGAATAQGGNLMATSPEMAAYYNSIAQQDLVLAAQADQEARNRITYGSGLFDTGANLQGRYYSGQTAALAPFTNPMDVTSGLESLAQTPLTLGTQIGAKTTASAAEAGRLTGQGIINAASTMAPANAYSLGGNVLAGVAGSPNVTGALNRAFGVTAQPTQQQYTFNPVTGQYVPVQQSVFAT